MRTILTILILACIIALGIYFPVVWWILGFGLFLVIALIFFVVKGVGESDDSNMKYKFGEDYKKLIEQGKLGLRTAVPCRPELCYTSKKEMESLAKIRLPLFTIKECKETLPDFTGDYSGEAEIEFEKAIDGTMVQKIEAAMRQGNSLWRKEGGDVYTCDLLKPDLGTPVKDSYWTISIQANSALGTIRYGRV